MENLSFFANSGAKWLSSGKDLYTVYAELSDKGDESASEFIFGIFVSFLRKKMAFEKISELLRTIKEKKPTELSDVLQMVWVVGVFVESLNKQVEERDYADITASMSQLVRNITEAEEKLTPEITLIDYLSENQMKAFSKIEEKMYNFKRRKWNTKIFYFQTKYNLFSQQNEGFAKLLALLLDAPDDSTAEFLYDGILSLIGYFDLDPDRVVESILNIYISKPNLSQFKELLRHFSRKSIENFLGKKFEFLDSVPDKSKSAQFRNATIIAAHLVKADVISLDSLWPYLSPTDKELEEKAEKATRNAVAYYTDSFALSLTIGEEEAKKKKEEEDKQMNFSGKFLDNQKLWMLDALVRVNSWGHFCEAFSYLYSCIDLKMYPPLLESLLDLLEWSIDKVYSKISPSRFFSSKQNKFPSNKYLDTSCQKSVKQLHQADTLVECIDLIDQFLRIVKSYIGYSPVLYTKILRLFRYVVSSNQERNSPTALDTEIVDDAQQLKMKNQIQELAGLYLLPGVQAFECNPGAVAEFWNLFKRYDYQIRLSDYMACHTEHLFTCGQLLIKQGKALRDIKDIFNKFNLENKKLYAKKIVKIANNSPFIIQNFIMRRLLQTSFENLIPDIVGSFQNGTALAQDIFIYLILQYIYDKKDKNGKPEKKYDESKGSIAPWFRIASLFISNFYKKFHDADMIPIVMYLIHSFSISCNLAKSMIKPTANVAADLFIFKELLAKMSGFELPNILNESQLQALAGGITLQVQSLKLNEDVRKCKKSQKALEAFLWQRQPIIEENNGNNSSQESHALAYQFLLLLGQEKTKFFDSYFYGLTTMEIFSDMVTDCFNLLIFFIRFQCQEGYKAYSRLIPPKALKDLILTYMISPEIAFQIVRPGLKPLSEIIQKDEQQALFKEIKDIYDSMKYPQRLINKHGMENENDILSVSLENYEEMSIRKLWSVCRIELVCTFWLLSLENISMNKEGYKFQADVLKKQIQEKGNDKNKKEKEKIDQLIKKLEDEDRIQTKLHQKYEDYLNSVKDALILPTKREQLEAMLSELCTHCLIPRAILDQNEALYSSRFLMLLLKISQAGLNDAVRSIKLAAQKILPFMQVATEKEALNISIFLNDILKPFSNYLDGSDRLQQSLKTYIHNNVINDKYQYEKYSSYIHSNILDEMFKIMQQFTKNELQVRNTMILLNSLKEIFPKTKQQAAECKKFMESLAGKFKGLTIRIDIYLNWITSLKGLPDAPPKSVSGAEKEKKVANNKASSPDRSTSKKDKSRERTPERTKDKKDDRYNNLNNQKKDLKK